MRLLFTCCGSDLLGATTSIFGYGWFMDGGGLNPAGVFVNLLGVGVIVALGHALFKEHKNR